MYAYLSFQKAVAGSRVIILGLNIKVYEQPIIPSSSSPISSLMSTLAISTPDEDKTQIRTVQSIISQRKTASSIKVKNGSRVQFLGFYIERKDITANETVSLNIDGRPIQKFLWGDYEVLPGKE